MLFLNGVPILILSILKNNDGLREFNIKLLIWGIIAGILAILSYGIVVWSMQYIEIAYVSSIRETSIVLATIIGFFILKEKEAIKRILPAFFIVVGISILYFQL
tara:strand:- start:324 stop:635 length:312 start_codon:yes stop_codon:yes gene_type:complete